MAFTAYIKRSSFSLYIVTYEEAPVGLRSTVPLHFPHRLLCSFFPSQMIHRSSNYRIEVGHENLLA